jgi:hypothetical protein
MIPELLLKCCVVLCSIVLYSVMLRYVMLCYVFNEIARWLSSALLGQRMFLYQACRVECVQEQSVSV